MTAPFNFGQLKFLKALTEALFHDATMAITADQVVANIVDLFAKVGGTKLDEIRLSLTASELVLGPMFAATDVAVRAARVATLTSANMGPSTISVAVSDRRISSSFVPPTFANRSMTFATT